MGRKDTRPGATSYDMGMSRFGKEQGQKARGGEDAEGRDDDGAAVMQKERWGIGGKRKTGNEKEKGKRKRKKKNGK